MWSASNRGFADRGRVSATQVFAGQVVGGAIVDRLFHIATVLNAAATPPGRNYVVAHKAKGVVSLPPAEWVAPFRDHLPL